MHQGGYLASFLTIGGLVALLNWYGVSERWYETHAYFDILMHVLGGVWVALGYGIVVRRCSLRARRYRSLALTLVAVTVVGLIWELYEWGIGVQTEGYIDPLVDMVSDLCGGWIGYRIARMFKWYVWRN